MAGKTREELEAEWWAAWWEADYSWDGLANHKIGGDGGAYGEQTLQDYWLRDPATGKLRSLATLKVCGEILVHIDANGAEAFWHIVHLPLHWRDGTSAKAAWQDAAKTRLASVVSDRFRAASETAATVNYVGESIKGSDCRAQLNGAVLPVTSAHPDGPAAALHLTARRSYLPVWNARGQRFGPGADFRFAAFPNGADFECANFFGDIDFGSAFFTGNANFLRAIFTGDAGFSYVTFTGNANLGYATFTSNADFFSATFVRYAGFLEATFARNTSFRNATIIGSVYFRGASFTGNVDFRQAQFEGEYNGKLNSGKMSFALAQFAAQADFSGAVFARNPRNHSAAFNGAKFALIADFQNAGLRTADPYKRSIGWIAALDEAIFEKSLLLDDPRQGDEDFDVVIARCQVPPTTPYETSTEDLLKQLEGGARVAKVAMGKARDEIKEQQFYRMQLIARRAQLSGWTWKWPFLN